jgi:hypothetical protein
MGIEDPIWVRIVIVLVFIGILLGFLYFSKLKGKKFFSQLSSNEFLKLDETISISNISKASLISVGSNKFLIIHGRGQSPSIIDLPINNTPEENLLQIHEDITR